MSWTLSVLVVDDDVDVRSAVAEALLDEGIEVTTAENGRAALATLRSGMLPDVILLDIMMPEMDGWAFRAEQQRDPELDAIPVVVFTAYGVPRETAEEVAASAYLKKPVRLDELLQTLSRFRRDGMGGDAKTS